MNNASVYPRFARERLLEALRDTPSVLIHGPRQCGKTTLAQDVGRGAGYAYFSFDDENVLAVAKEDPVGFVADLPERAILDEVQRVPDLFASLKLSIDRNRLPGRLILTGSANVLLLPRLSDTMAGRMEIQRLYPLAQCELEGSKPVFLDALFSEGFRIACFGRLGSGLAERIIAGGYPAALARQRGRRLRDWYRSYVETVIQREILALSRLSAFDAVPRLLELAAGQTARLLNVSELAAPFQLSRPTIRDYVTLLERVFLLEFLSPWHSNRISRLVKTAKLHMADTGLAGGLLGIGAEDLLQDRSLFGQLLETFIYGELKRQASWNDHQIVLQHYRDKDGYEVDIVMQRGAREIAGIEVKASGTVTEKDFRGLRRLREKAGKQWRAGVVLYDGENILPFGNAFYAVPISALWKMTAASAGA